ncbi:MAG: hemolysin III family protein [Treponema sp.]|jgi:hemolysin III|nr:hemolysin III family protein [Treponema sp.]
MRTSSVAEPFPLYSIGENIANSVLHGIGTLWAIAGLVLLNIKIRSLSGRNLENSLDITAALLFTATMIGMFLISTLYHSIQHYGAKRVLRILDHSMVYVFIAGTYTPFCLSALGGVLGWSIFFIEWALALLGITLYCLNFKALKKVEVAAYILMGWVIIVGLVPLFHAMPMISFILLFAGGIVYSLGTVWYRKKHLRKTHAIWHCFVLAGALCHWLAVWFLN